MMFLEVKGEVTEYHAKPIMPQNEKEFQTEEKEIPILTKEKT
jgi:hypothetical protein